MIRQTEQDVVRSLSDCGAAAGGRPEVANPPVSRRIPYISLCQTERAAGSSRSGGVRSRRATHRWCLDVAAKRLARTGDGRRARRRRACTVRYGTVLRIIPHVYFGSRRSGTAANRITPAPRRRWRPPAVLRGGSTLPLSQNERCARASAPPRGRHWLRSFECFIPLGQLPSQDELAIATPFSFLF